MIICQKQILNGLTVLFGVLLHFGAILHVTRVIIHFENEPNDRWNASASVQLEFAVTVLELGHVLWVTLGPSFSIWDRFSLHNSFGTQKPFIVSRYWKLTNIDTVHRFPCVCACVFVPKRQITKNVFNQSWNNHIFHNYLSIKNILCRQIIFWIKRFWSDISDIILRM